MLTGGSPPPPVVIKRLREEVNIHARTGYGLTETYGAASTYQEDPEWTSEFTLCSVSYCSFYCYSLLFAWSSILF